MVGLGGFEPPTLRLSGVRSNQLSYRPDRRGHGSGRLAQQPTAGTDPYEQAAAVEEWMASERIACPVLATWIAPHGFVLRKEVIQPQVPLRLPCYDLVPITRLAFGAAPLAVRLTTSGAPSFRGLTGGVYKAQEHIHRGIADPRLLAIPTSRRRVSACDPN